MPTDDQSQLSEFREAIMGRQMPDFEKTATRSEIPKEKITISNDIKPSNIDQSSVSNIDESAIVSRESSTKSHKVDSFIYSQSLKSPVLERSNNEIGNFDKSVKNFTGFESVSLFGQSAEVPSQPFLNVKDSTKRLGSTGLLASSELSSDKAMFLSKNDPVSSVLPPSSLQSSKTENYGTGFGTANAFTGFAGKHFQPKDVPSPLTQSGRQLMTGGGKIESIPVIRSSQISLQDNFSLGRTSNEKQDGSERNYSNVPLAKPVSSERNLFKQFANVSILKSIVRMA